MSRISGEAPRDGRADGAHRRPGGGPGGPHDLAGDPLPGRVGVMTAERRLIKLEGALSPKAASLLWLAQAQEFRLAPGLRRVAHRPAHLRRPARTGARAGSGECARGDARTAEGGGAGGGSSSRPGCHLRRRARPQAQCCGRGGNAPLTPALRGSPQPDRACRRAQTPPGAAGTHGSPASDLLRLQSPHR